VVLEFARRKLDRGRALLEKGAISESEVDALDQEAQIAETSVRLAEISIQSLREEIEDTRIYAPVSGQISRRLVSLGETVSPSTILFTLIQVSPIKVVTEIAEPYLHKIRKGASAMLVFEAVSSEPVTGKVHFIHPVSNPASGAFPTEIRLLNRGGRIQPGMVARVQIKAETFHDALVAPLDALVDFDGEYFVFTVEDGIAFRKPVRIVRRLGPRAVITGEIKAGDFLVSSGNANLTDGTAVEVIS
jgi:RND family efflux transporter MFP subunit